MRTSATEGVQYTGQVQLYETIIRPRIEKELHSSTFPTDSDNNWSPARFKEWYFLTMEVIAGLKRGYIDYQPRFMGDLDGICSRVYITDLFTDG